MEVVRLKPHLQVKDEMARFMPEVAPAFPGSPAWSPELGRSSAEERPHFAVFKPRPNSIVIRLIGRLKFVDRQRNSLIR